MVYNLSTVSNQKINFGRALTSKEKTDFVQTSMAAKEKIGNTGHSILIVHDVCLPQNESKDVGAGHLLSDTSAEFFDMMKSYLGINSIKVLPQGELFPRKEARFQSAYSSAALSLGTHEISLEHLTSSDYGNILSKEDVDDVVKTNNTADKALIVNYENIVGPDTSHGQALKKAFENFKKSDTPKVVELKKQFETYKKQNDEWLEPKGIFEVLKKEHNTFLFEKWENEVDKNLYNPDFDRSKAKQRIDNLTQKHSEEIEFYKFKQFLADEHLKESKQKLNQKGLKLFGDCLIGFSKDEVWANPKAFEKDAFIGDPAWKLPALDYGTIKDENSDAAKLLNKKVELFAKRYDAIRFDVGWAYIQPAITIQGESKHPYQGDKILNMIEKTVKKVKGNDFDLKNLIYEVEAGPEDFSSFAWDNTGKATIIEPLKNRVKVFSTVDMHSNWGSVDFLQNNAKLSSDEFVIMPGNHDPIPLRQLAECHDPLGNTDISEITEQKYKQLEPLSKSLNLDVEKLDNPIEFTKAKFAEVFTAKNNKFFYMDVLGRNERFDSQKNNAKNNYRYKISDKFESEYHKALQEGRGLNLMDSMDKVFKAKGLDKTHPELYASIVKYRDILAEKGATTEKEANELFDKSSKVKNKFLKPLLIGLGALGMVGVGFAFYSKKKDKKTAANL